MKVFTEVGLWVDENDNPSNVYSDRQCEFDVVLKSDCEKAIAKAYLDGAISFNTGITASEYARSVMEEKE